MAAPFARRRALRLRPPSQDRYSSSLRDVDASSLALLWKYFREALPQTINLAAPILDGQVVRLQGRFYIQFASFKISLTKHSQESDEITPFHMNLRTNGIAVLNTKNEGYWGFETHFQHFYTAGQKFTIHIRCRRNYFDIYLGYIHMYSIEHSFPLTDIEQICIKGDARMSSVEWGGGNMQVPFLSAFPPMREGRVVITGVASKDFSISFVDSRSEQPFYLNCRFSESKVVANSIKIIAWEHQQTASVNFPFEKGSLFEITILNGPHQLTINHNDVLLMKFDHRVADPGRAYIAISVTNLDELWTVLWN
uniref:Galectin n=1 Tax=Steinernema glaseri TaxID=37863 RepID=A0A1I7YRS0_9BILA